MLESPSPDAPRRTVTEGKVFVARAAAFEVAKQELICKFNVVCYIPQTKQFINLDHGRGKAPAAVTD